MIFFKRKEYFVYLWLKTSQYSEVEKVFEEFDQHFLWWIFNSKRIILSLPLSFQLLLGPNLKIKWAAFNFLLTMIFWNNESLKCIPFSFLSLISLWNSFLQDIFLQKKIKLRVKIFKLWKKLIIFDCEKKCWNQY